MHAKTVTALCMMFLRQMCKGHGRVSEQLFHRALQLMKDYHEKTGWKKYKSESDRALDRACGEVLQSLWERPSEVVVVDEHDTVEALVSAPRLTHRHAMHWPSVPCTGHLPPDRGGYGVRTGHPC